MYHKNSVHSCTSCIRMILHYTDDPESRMLYEHHGENEMMTSFINVRAINKI